MSWVAVAVGGGALLGYMNQKQQREQKKEEMMANAEQIRMSPWTGAKAQVEGYGNTASPMMGAAQGGLTGAMMASQFKGSPQATPTAAPEKAFDGKVMAGDPGAGSTWTKMQEQKPSMWQQDPNANPFERRTV